VVRKLTERVMPIGALQVSAWCGECVISDGSQIDDLRCFPAHVRLPTGIAPDIYLDSTFADVWAQ
jgi:hypothetical protein